MDTPRSHDRQPIAGESLSTFSAKSHALRFVELLTTVTSGHDGAPIDWLAEKTWTTYGTVPLLLTDTDMTTRLTEPVDTLAGLLQAFATSATLRGDLVPNVAAPATTRVSLTPRRCGNTGGRWPPTPASMRRSAAGTSNTPTVPRWRSLKAAPRHHRLRPKHLAYLPAETGLSLGPHNQDGKSEWGGKPPPDSGATVETELMGQEVQAWSGPETRTSTSGQ